MKNLTRQNPGQLFVAQELINKVIKLNYSVAELRLNIPGYQINKDISLTDYYFCISLHDDDGVTYASFLGLIDKKKVLNGDIGDLFVAGTTRIRQDGSTFRFMRDTYEVMFRHIIAPPITPHIQKLPGFRNIYLLPGRQNNRY